MRADDLRYMPKTNELLAQGGRTFERAYVTTPACCPSRATTLTGQYAHNHGVLSNEPPTGGHDKFKGRGDRRTVAITLQNAGYETALVGKYLNFYRSRGYVPPGWDRWFAWSELRLFSDEGETYSRPFDYHHDDLLADQSERFVRDVPEGKPFFLYVSSLAPKNPPAPRHEGAYEDTKVLRTLAFNEADVKDEAVWVRRLERLKGTQAQAIDEKQRKWAESLLAVDEMVERLHDAVRERGGGSLENTCFVFTSDNGFHMGEHRLLPGKGSPYEEAVRASRRVRRRGSR